MTKPKIFQKIFLKLSPNITKKLRISIYGSVIDPLNLTIQKWNNISSSLIETINDYIEFYTHNFDLQYGFFKLEFELIEQIEQIEQINTISMIDILNITIFFTHPTISLGSGELIIYSDKRNDSAFHFGNKKNYSLINEYKNNTNDLTIYSKNSDVNSNDKNQTLTLSNSNGKTSIGIGTSNTQNNKLIYEAPNKKGKGVFFLNYENTCHSYINDSFENRYGLISSVNLKLF
jgi:hypothetical protein